jgi:hypothetical protein
MNEHFIGLCKCTGTSYYIQDKKLHLILALSTNLDCFSSYHLL